MKILPLFSALLLILLSLAATCEKTPRAADCIDPDKIDRDAACIQVYEPVCGCDGNTYSNACMARIAGLMSWTEGECNCIDPDKIDPDSPCTKEYNPVCGCNNVTYSNPCMAEKAGVQRTQPGPCPNDG